MMRYRPTASTCTVCGRLVTYDEITMLAVVFRMYWFLTGMCQGCQMVER